MRRNALRLLTPYGLRVTRVSLIGALRCAGYAGYGLRVTRVTVCGLRGLSPIVYRLFMRLLIPGLRVTRVRTRLRFFNLPLASVS